MAVITQRRMHKDGVGGCTITEYDFSTDGGAVGDINLSATLPKDAIVYDGMIDVITDPTSGGAATIALRYESAGDVLAATAIGSVTGQVKTVPDNSAANCIKLTAKRDLIMTVATAALTAGKLVVVLKYFESYPL